MPDYAAKHAELLLDYSVGLRPKERILLSGTDEALPLLRELWRGALMRDAQPILDIKPDWQARDVIKHGRGHAIDFYWDQQVEIYRSVDARIVIKSESNLAALSGLEGGSKERFGNKKSEALNYVWGVDEDGNRNVRVCATIHPTFAYAQDAGMDIEDFSTLMYGAMMLDRDDPTRSWNTMRQDNAALEQLLKDAETVRLEGPGVDLTLNVASRGVMACMGNLNMPDGEIFTSPVEDSTEGYITFSEFPQFFEGDMYEDITLRFSRGEVVDASATKNEDKLHAVLARHKANILGEFALGTNYRVKQPTGNILLDEKVGGAIHIALGQGFEEVGGGNGDAAIHWDLVKDMREGTVWIDGTPLQWQGRAWHQPEDETQDS